MNKVNWLPAAAVVLLCTTPARADRPSIATGGGTGTFYADLDGDGDVDGSHFRVRCGQRAWGLGTWSFHVPDGRQRRFPRPEVDAGGGTHCERGVSARRKRNFQRRRQRESGERSRFQGGPLHGVRDARGGPETGTMQLTVIGAFDGVPGDTLIGDSNYSLPVETVATGSISIE